jgi:2-keto-3-deoxy-L-rhamnonate aldolase RhmA
MTFPDVRSVNPLKARLQSGQTAAGTFLTISGPEVAEICGLSGCDFVIIDTEHTPIGWERIAATNLAALHAGTCPIIRVGTTQRDAATRALDSGARAIMYAQVSDARAAHEAVAGCLFPPDGVRGVIGSSSFGYGLKMSLAEYIPAANRNMVCIIQIETLTAVNNVEEIAKVAGIDCLFVGLTDLSVDLGCPGDYTNVKVEAALDRVLQAAKANGVPVGIPITDPSLAASYHQRGATFFATTDRSFVTSGVSHWMRNIAPRK